MIFYDFEKKIVRHLSKKINNFGNANKDIVNIHRFEMENSGDLMSAPYLYFEKLKNFERIDVLGYLSKNILKTISWPFRIKNKSIILGGGGLLDRATFYTTVDVLKETFQQGNKVVLWGVGHNNPNLKISNKYYNQIKSFEVVGVRDYGINGVDWVPCASCMNDLFTKKYQEERQIGVVEHESIPIEGVETCPFPVLKNKSKFEDIINFIGSSEKIITNSYHVMYWSILLKRKVIVIPNSSKMFSFKYKVPFADNINDYKFMFNQAVVYDGVLEECRIANNKFSEKVFNYLNI